MAAADPYRIDFESLGPPAPASWMWGPVPTPKRRFGSAEQAEASAEEIIEQCERRLRGTREPFSILRAIEGEGPSGGEITVERMEHEVRRAAADRRELGRWKPGVARAQEIYSILWFYRNVMTRLPPRALLAFAHAMGLFEKLRRRDRVERLTQKLARHLANGGKRPSNRTLAKLGKVSEAQIRQLETYPSVRNRRIAAEGFFNDPVQLERLNLLSPTFDPLAVRHDLQRAIPHERESFPPDILSRAMWATAHGTPDEKRVAVEVVYHLIARQATKGETTAAEQMVGLAFVLGITKRPKIGIARN
jgi:hypothetical protein